MSEAWVMWHVWWGIVNLGMVQLVSDAIEEIYPTQAGDKDENWDGYALLFLFSGFVGFTFLMFIAFMVAKEKPSETWRFLTKSEPEEPHLVDPHYLPVRERSINKDININIGRVSLTIRR